MEKERKTAISLTNVIPPLSYGNARERAEHRLGEMLKSAKVAGQIGPGQPQKNASNLEGYSRVKLSEAGIDKKLSAASLPAFKFDNPVELGLRERVILYQRHTWWH